jgi:Zn-dependent protease with chaperone function
MRPPRGPETGVTAETERPCPECQAAVPVVPGYPDWCDRCGWNVKPPPTLEPPAGRFAQLAREAGRRAGERMARELQAARELRPRWTPARVAAYVIALAFHLATLALIVAGAAAIVIDFPNLLSILLGGTMLGLGLLIRPRFDRLEPDAGHLFDRASAPTLHDLAAEVARAVDRRPPDEIRISADWNASWRVVGARRRRVLTLGLPVLVALESPQRVALVGHEVGHERNGDARHGFVVGSAVIGLNRLSDVLQPRQDERVTASASGSLDSLARALMWLIARPIDAALWLEARLLLRDMQRAEYLADALAAQVAGSRATIALHERVLLASTFQLAVQQAAHENATDVLDRVRQSLRRVPDRERERRRRVARLEQTRLDDTHPPTGMRIALIEGRPPQQPRVVLNEARSRRIDAELEPLVNRVDRELLDAYRSRLYYG